MFWNALDGHLNGPTEAKTLFTSPWVEGMDGMPKLK